MSDKIALCSTLEQSEADKLFFSEAPKKIAKAIALCEMCEMKDPCLKMALVTQTEFGVFGGTTPQQRKAML